MSFTNFSFSPHIAQAINACGFTQPTPIQNQAIPAILEGSDVLGLAQTGTGKTAAFILPLIQHLMQTQKTAVRALIIAPTRELAEQINDFTQKIIDGTNLRSLSIYGGVGKQGQIMKLRKGVDIVIACPGRLLDIIQDNGIDLGSVETLILDEADQMFDKGFLPDIRRILSKLPTKRQTLVFSATMPGEIQHLTKEILSRPVTVQISPSRSVKSITHHLYTIEQAQKTTLLLDLVREQTMPSTVVFTRTKHRAKNLARKLANSGFKATCIQGNLSQNKRQQALDGFKDGTFNILVATDIAARGIDVAGVSHVINFDMPDTAEAYIHRTGRTGRASRSGDALTFATGDDKRLILQIEKLLDKPMIRMNRVNASKSHGKNPDQTARQHSGHPIKNEKSDRPPRRRPAKQISSRANQKKRRANTSPSIFGLSEGSRQ